MSTSADPVARTPTRSANAPAVVLDEVSKVYGMAGGAVAALDRASRTVRPGEFVCIVGASGCGKSTLLNLIADLDQPSAGRIDRPPGRAALMFQEAALFPWLTVGRNVLGGVGSVATATLCSPPPCPGTWPA